MGKRLDLVGQKFGRLVVLVFAFIKNRQTYWDCICDCGNTITARGNLLTIGNTRSCGGCACQISA
jgi:hypothetical protein